MASLLDYKRQFLGAGADAGTLDDLIPKLDSSDLPAAKAEDLGLPVETAPVMKFEPMDVEGWMPDSASPRSFEPGEVDQPLSGEPTMAPHELDAEDVEVVAPTSAPRRVVASPADAREPVAEMSGATDDALQKWLMRQSEQPDLQQVEVIDDPNAQPDFEDDSQTARSAAGAAPSWSTDRDTVVPSDFAKWILKQNQDAGYERRSGSIRDMRDFAKERGDTEQLASMDAQQKAADELDKGSKAQQDAFLQRLFSQSPGSVRVSQLANDVAQIALGGMPTSNAADPLALQVKDEAVDAKKVGGGKSGIYGLTPGQQAAQMRWEEDAKRREAAAEESRRRWEENNKRAQDAAERARQKDKDIAERAKRAEARRDAELKLKEKAQELADKKTIREGEAEMRKEFNGLPDVKAYNEINRQYTNLKNSLALQTGAGDQAAIMVFNKVLDPGSVVRESEFATTANGAGLMNYVEAKMKSLASGEKLTEDSRAQLLEAATKLFEGAAAPAQAQVDRYSGIADDAGFNPGHIVQRWGQATSGEVPAPSEKKSPVAPTPISPSRGPAKAPAAKGVKMTRSGQTKVVAPIKVEGMKALGWTEVK